MILTTALNDLETTELVRRLDESDLAYLIKHALVQDTVRGALLRHDRKRLHRLVGETLETLYPERRAEFAALLAQHFADAGDDEKTLVYLTLAGAVATRINANTEALQHYTKALALARKLNAPIPQVQDLFLKRGRVLEVQDDLTAALENYDEMERLSQEKQAPALELACVMAAATLHCIPSQKYDPVLARALGERALVLAQTLGDRAAEAKILWNVMLLNSRANTQYRQAVELGERALTIARAEHLTEQVAYLLNDLSPIHGFLGDPERARQYNLEARAMWRELGNVPMLTDNLGYAVMNTMFAADYAAAIQASEEALRLSREIGNTWGETFAQTWVGQAYWEFGEITSAIRVMENALQLAQISFPAPLVLTNSDLARLYAEFGDTDRALDLAQQAVEKATVMFPSMKAWALGALGLVYLRKGELAAAFETVRDVPLDMGPDTAPLFEWERIRVRVECLIADHQYQTAGEICDRVRDHLRSRNVRMYYAVFQILAARVHVAQGDSESAFALLEAARIWCLDQNARWSLWQVLGWMARVQEKRGQSADAAALRAQARTCVESIAARTPETLRASFLKQALDLYEP